MSAVAMPPAGPRPGLASAATARVYSIRTIVAVTAVVLVTTAVVSVGAVSERQARRTLTEEIENRLLLEARNLAFTSSGALLGDFPELTLQPVVREMLTRQPELASVIVLDHQGQIQGHPDAHMLGHSYVSPNGLLPITSSVRLNLGERLRGNAKLVVASAPVLHPSGRGIGQAVVELRRSSIERMLLAQRAQKVGLLVVFAFVGAVATFLLLSYLLRPIAALRAGIERIGAGRLDERILVRDRTELGLLASALNEMTQELQTAQAGMLERERLSHEMGLARDIQRALLPHRDRVAGSFTILADQRAAAEVGGDYYDVLRLDDGRIALAIADVSGKGLSGCLVMSMLSALLRSHRNGYRSPAQLLGALNDMLSESLQPGVFVTMFYGILEPTTGELSFSSAGHNPLLIRRAADGAVEQIQSRGVPLGAVRDARMRETLTDEVVQLEPGDIMLQFTDGFTESFHCETGEQFGFDRLADMLAASGSGGPEQLRSALNEALTRWHGEQAPDDDQTLLVVARASSPVPAPGEDVRPDATLERLARAERTGIGLRLDSTLDAVARVREWVRQARVLRRLSATEHDLLASGLFEICGNIAEHGYRGRPDGLVEVWWLPPEAVPDEEPVSADRASELVRNGRFLVRDDARPYSGASWSASDFRDPAVWRRGRGLGLDIVHRMMREVAFNSATARGNITTFVFDPPSLPHSEEGAQR